MTSTLLRGMSELVTNDPTLGPTALGLIEDAALIIQDGRVAWVGPAGTAPPADQAVDLGGRAVLPGWVDSHSHVIYAGDRSAEFAARMAGEPYRAGGMRATVEATRAVDDRTLLATARRHRAEMLLGGTTCAETKTGYGLTVPDERRAALTATAAGFDEITFLGAHVVPVEYAKDPDGYVDLVCGPMLEAVADAVRWIDVFCEDGAFDEAQSRRVLAAGQRKGLGLRVHGNQLGPGPGVRLAVDLGAASVDHCTHLTPTDLEALAASSTVATLLPACDLSTRQPPAPGRALLDAGARVALASNCNPGSSYTSSMNLVVALAVLQCAMSTAEAVHAATAGGAAALRRDDVGHLAPGAWADLHVLDAPSHAYLAYRVGMPLTHRVFRHGVEITG
ncbi:imidazolonepropionase [Nakamurella multipartita]|uniref:Imidazolonepropionase n=1 Tax=Nakamurella multipartita (strain ATCC 700099 / DSM 44233 / CIP 104796 / JCM 9543 / NBRC 105858 / Y-104) TaxID=479431 RepID=C8XEG6_NAKMY|nr:imidazolonepropionase [Nakamurella multipartita]ACV77824.1 imidazolonepropionase [Nakamurella multipartita DSM 44233]